MKPLKRKRLQSALNSGSSWCVPSMTEVTRSQEEFPCRAGMGMSILELHPICVCALSLPPFAAPR